MFLFIFPRAFQLKCSDFSSLNECVGYRWNRNTNTSHPWENEQKHRFQKHQKLNKSSMVDTWVFVDFGHFWNWFLWSFSERISTKVFRFFFSKRLCSIPMKCWYQCIIRLGKWSNKPISEMSKINKISCINHGRFIQFLTFLKFVFLFIFPRVWGIDITISSETNEFV